EGDFVDMNRRSVSSIIQKGGTVLKSARCPEFRTKEGPQQAYENLKSKEIDALVAIGGDGTFTGAYIFSQEYDIPVICIPGTIDNDLYGSAYTLGYDTAYNTVIQAIEKIRDAPSSHSRVSYVVVMGPDSGCFALNAGGSGGAESILLPAKDTGTDELMEEVSFANEREKSSMIGIGAEGDINGGAYH